MNSKMEMGRLESVPLREIWQSEPADFTPWLAKEENISILGDAIGTNLEVVSKEQEVGRFKADILCKDTATTERWVLIENQLDRTDHIHLGQLMTYAAGLEAVTVVWIAKKFTDEHRASLDWLNEIVSDKVQFFGIEIELWRIGASLIAPKFNIVSKPNDWTRPVSGLTEHTRFQLDYWTALREVMEQRGGVVNPTKPKAQHWQDFSIGRTNFILRGNINAGKKRIGVQLILQGADAKAHYSLLYEDKETIEAELGQPLDWKELPTNVESQINWFWENCDPSDQSSWRIQHDWFYEKLTQFHHTFAARIKKLDCSQFTLNESKTTPAEVS